MNVAAFISGELRPALHDETPADWTDTQLRAWITKAVRDLHANHPETRVAAAFELRDSLGTTLGDDDVIPLDDLFLVPLMDGVMALAFESDASDDADRARAKLHRDNIARFFGE